MEAYEIFTTLTAQGAKIQVSEGKLSIRAPDGVITPHLRVLIAEKKQDIIALISALDIVAIPIERASDKPYYVLSSAQRRMYFLHEQDKASLTYNMPQLIKMEGMLDKRRLETAFERLIRRHEILRTRFAIIDNTPVQFVEEAPAFSIAYYNGTEMAVPGIIQAFIRPFYLGQAPLLRVGVIELDRAGQYVLMVDMHHIVTDGVSHGVLMRDFMQLYKGEPLPAIRLQYKDYAEWQQALPEQKSYWLQEFAQLPDPLVLPTDYPRRKIRNPGGGSVSFSLDKKKVLLLKKQARQENATMFMVLLSVYTIVLSKLSNQEDVVVGTSAAGRPHADLERMIGLFVNILPLRNYPRPELTFSAFLRNLQARTLAAFDNQAYQYEALIEDLSLNRDGGFSGLFDVFFTYLNYETTEVNLPGLTFSPYQGHSPATSKFDLLLAVSESDEQLFLQFQYATDIFTEETIKRFTKYFCNIIETVVADPDIRLSSLSLITAEEQSQILNDFNATARVYPRDRSIVDLFEEQVHLCPSALALQSDTETLTYQQLNNRANQLAYFLQQEGMRAEECVGVLAGRSVQAVVAILGILKAGGAYLPLDSDFPPLRLLAMLKDGGVDKVLAQGKHMDLLPATVRVFDIAQARMEGPPSDPVPVSSAESLAYVMYTSGSTGIPKGVAVTHRNVVRLVRSANYVTLNGATRILQTGSPVFDATTFEIWGSLLNGGSLFLAEKDVLLQTSQLGECLAKFSINTLWLTASLFDQHVVQDPEIFSGLTYLLVGGDRLTVQSINKVRQLHPGLQIINGYGPTENTTFSLCHTITRDHEENIPIGIPISNSTVYILDKGGHLQPIGIAGELVVGGEGVARGYINNAALTQEKFVANPYRSGERMYRTGDLGKWLPDGTVEFLGRADSQVKIRGFRIEPGEIEYYLREHTAIKEAVVVAQQEQGEKYLVAYYVSDGPLEIASLQQHLSAGLPAYMVPAHFVHLSRLPLSVNDKIDRGALPMPTGARVGVIETPVDSVEQQLVTMWAEVLKLDKAHIGLTQSFFELGGHSLRAVVLVNKIHKQLGVEIPLDAVFTHQSIRALAVFIASLQKSLYAGIGPAFEKPHYVLSSAQQRMYFIYLVDKTSVAYNIPQIVRLEGVLDKQRLEIAFDGLIRRHEILRTRFTIIDNVPVQCVDELPEFCVGYYKGTEASVPEIVQDFIRPFDLGQAPLLRVGVIDLPREDQYILMVDMHHIISDGVSRGILIHDFMQLYKGEFLPHIRLQYKDYAEWQQHEDRQPVWAEQKAYWLEIFTPMPELLVLPTDYRRPKIMSRGGGRVGFSIDKEATLQLRALALEENTTLFVVLLSAYTVLLSKLCNQEDIVVGTSAAGRPHADLEQMIGLFVNTLPLRNYPRVELTFRDFLQQLRANTLAAFDHQEYQYEALVDELRLDRDTSRNPLFDVFFSYLNFETATLDMPDLTLSAYHGHSHDISKFDLMLAVSESNEQLFLQFQYATDIFAEDTIGRFAKYLCNIIETVMTDPSIRLSALSLTTIEEQSEILSVFNATECLYPRDRSIIDLFEEQVRLYPSALALQSDAETLTYQQLNDRANQLAYFLQQEGMQAEECIGVLAGRSVQAVVAMLGILKAGGAYLPLDGDFPPLRLLAMLKDGGVDKVLAQNKYMNLFPTPVRVFDIEQVGMEAPSSNLLTVSGAENLAYVIYTSGSTGIPKGVSVTHRNVVRLVRSANYVTLNRFTRILQTGAPVFDATTFEIWGSLLNGGSLFLAEKEVLLQTAKLGEFLERFSINTLWLTASLFDQHAEQDPKIFSGLNYLLVGGDRLTAPAINKVRRLHPSLQIINGYGPTENTTFSLCHTITHDHEENIPIGIPVSNSTAYILDKVGRLQPIGIAGELVVGGDGVARGYKNNAALTQEKFVPNPFRPGERMYRTGDLGRWLPDGTVEFLGRADSQVKIRGFRIEPGEVEYTLLGHASIKEAVVMALQQQGEKYLVAYYVSDIPLDVTSLQQYLSDRLPVYMVPAHFVHLSKLPLTNNGKIDRAALPAPGVVHVEVREVPVGNIEQQLVTMWADVLKLDKAHIGLTQSFFELGGHSLRAVVLINKIHKQLGVEIPLDAIFTHQRIRGLAVFIASLQKSLFTGIEPVPAKAHYVLSSAQRRMYFLHQFDKTSVAYNMPQVIKLEGLLDKAQMEAAFQGLIYRHEILRTSVEIADNEPAQYVREVPLFKIEQYAGTEDDIPRIIRSFIRPFNLEQVPLLRVGVIDLPQKDQHILMVDMHHIVSDGVSQSILIRDFTQLYKGESLPVIRLQYKDYAAWQQHEDRQPVWAEQKAYWLETFAQLPEALVLPTDYSRPMTKSYRAGIVKFVIDKQETLQLKNLTRQEDTTVFIVLLTACNIFLSKLSNQEDVVVGTPVAGRMHADLEQMIGLFVNTLPLRNRSQAELTFNTFLRQVHRSTLAAFDNQAYQYEALIDDLKLERDTGRNPLFDVFFSYQNFEKSVLEIPGLKFSGYEAGDPTAKFDLTITAYDNGDELYLSFKYALDIFTVPLIEKFVDYFRQIVSQVIADPGIRIKDIDILTEQDRHYLLNTLNDTTRAYACDDTLVSLWQQQALHTPQNTALLYGQSGIDIQTSYHQVRSGADQIARQLMSKGINTGDVVGVLAERSAKTIISMLGILTAGGVYLPLDKDQPLDRLQHMVKESNARIVLGSGQSDHLLSRHVEIMDIDDVAFHTPADEVPSCRTITPDDTAYIIYTSGSTGNPKGIKVSHRSIVNYIEGQKTYYGIRDDDRILQFTIPTFDPSLEQIFLALLSGAMLVLPDQELLANPDGFSQFVVSRSITHLHATPSFLEQITLPVADHLRRVIAGGEACPVHIAKRYSIQYAFYNKYGPTEATISATAVRVQADMLTRGIVPIGKPLQNVYVYILGYSGELLPVGVQGELYIGGIGVAQGYLNDVSLTQARFVPNPFRVGERMYRTGDSGRWLPDGTIEFMGRVDSQVKIRGFRIEPGEIEYHLLRHAAIKEAVVIALQQQEEKCLVAYYVLEEPLDTPSLMQYLAAHLPAYMMPAHFVPLPSLPLTPNGKIDRRALPEPQVARVEHFVAPADETEQQLATIWADLLKLEEKSIGVTQSFFELGGHSLRAAVLVSKLHKQIGVEVPLKAVFTHQSIRSLAAFISTQQKSAYAGIEPAPVKANYVLSPAQRRMYFLQQLAKNSIAYNMPQVMRLEGALDKIQLTAVFQKLIQRHEILRTSIEIVDDEPVQCVREMPAFKIEQYKGTEASVPLTIRSFIRPFDLKQVPLLRVGVIDLADKHQHILMVDLHHIVTDGLSMAILVREFMQLYKGDVLPAARLQYKDYAEWLESSDSLRVLAKQKAYWLQVLAHRPEVLTLPTDYTRPQTRNHKGDLVTMRIDKQETLQLKALARQEGCTMFVVLLAIYNILLNRLGNQEDIVVGAPVAGRMHVDLEQTIGMFVNTIPLRNYPRRELTFRSFLQQVHNTTLPALEHQSFPYEELIDTLGVTRDMGHNPLFDVTFTYQNYDTTALEMPGLSLAPYLFGHTVSKFDLSLSVGVREEELSFSFEYATDLFRRETIEQFGQYFKAIIAGVCVNEDIVLGEIEILSQAEISALLDFNPASRDYPREETLVSLFEAQVRLSPDAIALRHNGKEMTYDALNVRANRLADYLMSASLKKGSVVALLLERSPDQIVGLLGILKVGCVYLPLDPTQPVERLAHMLRESKTSLLLTETRYAHKLDDLVPTVLITEGCEERHNEQNPAVLISPHDLVYIIYTSGSSGMPKGVMVTHQSVVNLCFSRQEAFCINEQECILQFSPLIFDASVEQIWLALLNGASLILVDRDVIADPGRFQEYIRSQHVTHFDTTPSFLEHVSLQQPNALKRIVVGGEECKWALVEKHADKYQFFNEYGPTETTVVATACLLSTGAAFSTRVPIGKPIANTYVYILDASQKMVPGGVQGELYIGGEGVALGYVNNSSLTQEKFVSNPFRRGECMYRTGDLGRWLPDGTIEFLGRADDQVKIRGFRIEPGEIEHHLLSHAAVTEAIVVALQQQEEKYLVAYYVAESAIETETLQQYLGDRLPAYMVPVWFVYMSVFPLTINGKIDLQALPVPDLAGIEDYVAAGNQTEQQLVAIWAGILKIEERRISVTKSFFELGGHSLRVMILANKIHQHFSVEMPLADIFKFPSIKALAERIRQKDATHKLLNKAMVLLKEVPGVAEDLFFIHDGSGEVHAYSAVAGMIEGFHCRGIRYEHHHGPAPADLSLKEIAAEYIRMIKAIQPQGPYRLVGWSLGGTIACEMTRQIEAGGERVANLCIIDSHIYPWHNQKENNAFSLEKEKSLLYEIVGDRPDRIRNATSVDALWQYASVLLQEREDIRKLVFEKMPVNMTALIQNADQLPMIELIYQINRIRTLVRAADTRPTDGEIFSKAVYIKAEESTVDVALLKECLGDQLTFLEMEGDHFSILQKGMVAPLAAAIQDYLNNASFSLTVA
jgi:tyrocidine synthetase-3